MGSTTAPCARVFAMLRARVAGRGTTGTRCSCPRRRPPDTINAINEAVRKTLAARCLRRHRAFAAAQRAVQGRPRFV